MCMKDGEKGKVLWQQSADFSRSEIEHEARIPKRILKGGCNIYLTSSVGVDPKCANFPIILFGRSVAEGIA